MERRSSARDPEWPFDSYGSVSLLVPWRSGVLGLWNAAVTFPAQAGKGEKELVS